MTKLTFFGFQIEWYNRSDMRQSFNDWTMEHSKMLDQMYTIYSASYDKMDALFIKHNP